VVESRPQVSWHEVRDADPPSLRKRIAARAPVARYVRRSVKAPRGWGWATNPRRAAHNRVYHRVKFDPIAALRALFRT